MKTWNHDSRGMGLFFALAIAVHAVLIMVPLTKGVVANIEERRSVKVRLVAPPQASRESLATEQTTQWQEPQVPALEELPVLPQPATPPAREIVRQELTPNSKRVLSSQFDYEGSVRKPLFGPVEQKGDAPDFHYRERATLEAVLNRPSLQLPFEDTRTYLVDHYEDGVMGGIEKFWDRVSVPFGFTTKNNTRVQCVWVLVIAGCGWGHKTLFHQRARYRERPRAQPTESG